jgi:hypothetical protein
MSSHQRAAGTAKWITPSEGSRDPSRISSDICSEQSGQVDRIVASAPRHTDAHLERRRDRRERERHPDVRGPGSQRQHVRIGQPSQRRLDLGGPDAERGGDLRGGRREALVHDRAIDGEADVSIEGDVGAGGTGHDA